MKRYLTAWKKAFAISLSALVVLSLAACGETKPASEKSTQEEASGEKTVELLSGKHHAVMEIADYGTIELELDADAAPITVTNFVLLADSGFYDGLTFHRIIEGFMMQGGDPNGNGTGGSGANIIGEFEANGIENPISHTRGTISMARSQNNNSASSQFFIMHEDGDFLDGQYAAFGVVTSGMDVVDKICTEAEPVDANGSIPSEAQPVITSLKILD